MPNSRNRVQWNTVNNRALARILRQELGPYQGGYSMFYNNKQQWETIKAKAARVLDCSPGAIETQVWKRMVPSVNPFTAGKLKAPRIIALNAALEEGWIQPKDIEGIVMRA